MELELFDDEKRGQVGIGTLIVFIAMVLVAAIAAGVLINTAGFLQSSAEESGTGASEQTTNRVTVTGSVTGTVDSLSGTTKLEKITINAKRTSGSSNIDLNDATIQFVGPTGTEVIDMGESSNGGDAGSPSSGKVTISDVKDDDTSLGGQNDGDAVLNDDTDVAGIQINLDVFSQKMDTGKSATMTLTTDAGGETEIRVSTPDTFQQTSVTLSP